MMPAMIRRSALLLLLVLATPLAMTAADLGKADGKLTVSGKSHKLTYAYAIEMTTDTREKFYKIFLTDVALTDKQIGLFPDVLFNEIKEGKIHAIRIGIPELLGEPGIKLIEWPKREFEEFEDSHIEVTIRVREDGTREITAENPSPGGSER